MKKGTRVEFSYKRGKSIYKITKLIVKHATVIRNIITKKSGVYKKSDYYLIKVDGNKGTTRTHIRRIKELK